MALCTITGTVYLPSGELAVSRRMTFRRAARNITPEYQGVVIPEAVSTTTDANGELSVELLTGAYNVSVSGEPSAYVGKAYVPDEASATFAEILQELPPVNPVPAWYSGITADIEALQSIPVLTTFTVEEGHFVLIYSDGSRLVGPATSSGPVANSRLSGDTWPAAPQIYPVGLIDPAASDFTDSTGWATAEGLSFDTVEGVAIWDGTNTTTSITNVALAAPAAIGDHYGVLASVSNRQAGTLFTGFQFPGKPTDGSGFVADGNYSRRVTVDAEYAAARMYVSAGGQIDVNYLQAYNISELMTKKWRIVFVYSQSNWVGPGDAPDRVQNDPPEPRAIVIPSMEQLTRGAVLDAEGLGVPMLMCDPVVHFSGNVGGGPAGAFSRTFCDGLRDDEVLIYVAAGYSGGGRMAPDGIWNRETDGAAWLNLLKQVDALVAKAPEGSTVAGCLFCQGEADLSINVGDQHAQTIRGDFELLRERWGEFPVVVSEIGWDDTGRVDVANMIASHAKLDSNSGDPLALSLCRYVPRPVGASFLPDALHYDQPTQRLRGTAAGTAMLELNYGTAQN